MPYYGAGDYYRAGGGNYAAGGFLGKLWGGVKSVARTAIGMTPVGRVAEAIIPPPTTQGGQRMEPTPGARGVAQRMVPGGETGFRPFGGGGKRMNMGNAKAARRAIRRIKGVRNLLQSIEKELPRRPAPRATRGVITRAEAARALRS